MRLVPDLLPETKVSRAPAAISREIDGDIVLLTPEDSTVHVLNDVGGRIWTLCAEPVSIEELAGMIAAEYEIDSGQARTDVISFVKSLLDLSIVRVE